MREATRQDRPVIGTIQTQCCICWRMFASDSICEKQKPYARLPGDPAVGRVSERSSCISDLAGLGLIARERSDGVIVWGVTGDEEMERRAQVMEKARAARVASAAAKRKLRVLERNEFTGS